MYLRNKKSLLFVLLGTQPRIYFWSGQLKYGHALLVIEWAKR